MDDIKWGKFMLENIYIIWFIIFNLRLKNDFREIFAKLIDYATKLLKDIKNKVNYNNKNKIKKINRKN